MGRENTILIGVNVSQSTLSRRRSNFAGRNLIESLPSSTNIWGKVLSINTSTKEIVYSLIKDTAGYAKKGTAIPVNSNAGTIPSVGSLVPLMKGPDDSTTTNTGTYSKTIYYGDPI